uniref:Metallophos domain-containing protein n=1 Tax=Haemonchus contortus TaxID=6289 RepID=A0A7I5EER9_HAECO
MRLSVGHYVFLGLFVVVQCVIIAFLLTLTGVDYYRLKRIHNLINAGFLMVLGSIFIWKRVTAALNYLDPDRITPARLRWRTICFQDVARASLLILLVLSQFSMIFYFLLLGTEPHILAQISLVGLAAYLHVIVFLVIAECLHFFSTLFLNYGVLESMNRYIVDNRHAFIFVSLCCALLFILGGLYTTITDPVYTHVTIHLEKLRQGELRVALLSDLHIGPTVGQKRMEKIAQITNELNPDVITIAGDLADGYVRDFAVAATPLCSLKAKYGVYFATGNHEYMHGNIEEWFAFLENCNITVLHNSYKRFVTKKGGHFCIAGADDLYAAKAHFPGHAMQPERAVSGCALNDTTIMLAHQPNAAKLMLSHPLVSEKLDLILSGHTHGGQMYLFVPIIYLANAFARGLYYHEATNVYVYVSAGVNFFGPPVKMFGGCEIIDILLKPLT